MPPRLARTRSMSAAKDGEDVTDSRVASPLVCVAMRWMAVAVRCFLKVKAGDVTFGG